MNDAPVLTSNERDQMAHAIGHHSAKGCSVRGGRNHYVTATDDPLWRGLVDRGFATTLPSRFLGARESSFRVSAKGRAAVEADPRSQRVGRRFAVRMRGCADVSYVWAETHAKARYSAVLPALDAWNITAGEAFTRIESCRLA